MLEAGLQLLRRQADAGGWISDSRVRWIQRQATWRVVVDDATSGPLLARPTTVLSFIDRRRVDINSLTLPYVRTSPRAYGMPATKGGRTGGPTGRPIIADGRDHRADRSNSNPSTRTTKNALPPYRCIVIFRFAGSVDSLVNLQCEVSPSFRLMHIFINVCRNS